MEETQFDLHKAQVVTTPCFGQECPPHEVDFRWYLGNDMGTLKRLTERHGRPLRLRKIRTRGSLTYGISAIQFIFDHGVESPVVDSDRPGAAQFKTTELPTDTEIASITVREYWPNFNMLKLGFTNGTELVICEFYPQGDERTLNVPEGLTVAGFYGHNDLGYFIRSLGFILMESPSPPATLPLAEPETYQGETIF